MSKKYYLTTDHYVKVLQPPNGARRRASKWKKHWLFSLSAKIWSPNTSSCSCSWSSSAMDAIWIFSSLQISIPGTVKTCLTGYLSLWLHLILSAFLGPLSRQVCHRSSVANRHDQLFKHLQDLFAIYPYTRVGTYCCIVLMTLPGQTENWFLEETVPNSLWKCSKTWSKPQV